MRGHNKRCFGNGRTLSTCWLTKSFSRWLYQLFFWQFKRAGISLSSTTLDLVKDIIQWWSISSENGLLPLTDDMVKTLLNVFFSYGKGWKCRVVCLVQGLLLPYWWEVFWFIPWMDLLFLLFLLPPFLLLSVAHLLLLMNAPVFWGLPSNKGRRIGNATNLMTACYLHLSLFPFSLYHANTMLYVLFLSTCCIANCGSRSKTTTRKRLETVIWMQLQGHYRSTVRKY